VSPDEQQFASVVRNGESGSRVVKVVPVASGDRSEVWVMENFLPAVFV